MSWERSFCRSADQPCIPARLIAPSRRRLLGVPAIFHASYASIAGSQVVVNPGFTGEVQGCLACNPAA